MKERLIVIPRKEDIRRNRVYIKLLQLLVPERAAEQYGLAVEKPVLTTIDTDIPFIYERPGQVLQAPMFAPRRWEGIRFEAIWATALTNGSMVSSEVQSESWVALVEPVGSVYALGGGGERIFNYRYARAVRIKEIRAYCYRCLKEDYPIPVTRPRVIDEPLSQGLAVDAYPTGGILKAICGLEKHPYLASYARYKFTMAENGEVILSKL